MVDDSSDDQIQLTFVCLFFLTVADEQAWMLTWLMIKQMTGVISADLTDMLTWLMTQMLSGWMPTQLMDMTRKMTQLLILLV